jgi:hypothetical protein
MANLFLLAPLVIVQLLLPHALVLVGLQNLRESAILVTLGSVMDPPATGGSSDEARMQWTSGWRRSPPHNLLSNLDCVVCRLCSAAGSHVLHAESSFSYAE